MAHAYYVAGNLEEGIGSSLSFIESTLGMSVSGNPDVSILRFATFSIDEVRRLIDFDMQAPAKGSQKAIVVSAARLYTPAQNALLKLFEEPHVGTTLFLVIPSEGVLLPTLRSRLVPLPKVSVSKATQAKEFLSLSLEERKSFVDKLFGRLDRGTKEEKQGVRQEALLLAQELLIYVHAQPVKKDEEKMKTLLLKDLESFVRVLHDASAPVKHIFEHLLLVLPDPTPLPRAQV